MKATLKPFFAIFCLATTALPTGSALASVLIQIEEVGSDLHYSGSGQLDVTGLTFGSSHTTDGNDAFLTPGNASIENYVPGAFDVYGSFLTHPTNFGPDSEGFAYTSEGATGDFFSINQFDLVLPGFYAAAPYVLNFAGSFAGESLASLSLAPGSYTWTWSNDSVTVQVVPEPATTVYVFGAGVLLLFAGCRRRRDLSLADR